MSFDQESKIQIGLQCINNKKKDQCRNLISVLRNKV